VKKELSLLVVCGLVLLFLVGCSPSATPAADADNILRVGNGAEPQELDPQIVTGIPEQRLTSTLFEGLVDADPETLDPIPGAAESWTMSEDGTQYIFRLQPNGRWSNGDPVTAQDFVYSWRRILTPGLASEYAYMLYCLKNAEAYHAGDTDDFSQVGVRALDDRTLEVTLESPTPYFLSMQTHHAWFPVHPPTIEAFEAQSRRGTKWTQPENIVGNGAFVLQEWSPNRVIRVVKNTVYWNAGAVRLAGIEFYPIDDVNAEERAFRSGKLHLTESIPHSKVPVYREKDPELLHVDPYLATYFYRFEVTTPPLDDVRVRRALSMAIDRTAVVENILKGGQRPAYCLTPPNTAGYSCQSAIKEDPDQARALLAEAGYPNGEGFPPIELLYNTSENHRLIAEALQQMWKKELGIAVNLLNQDWKVLLSTMNSRNYQMIRSSWVADYNDPVNFLECFTSMNGNNRTGYANPRYDRLIEKARQTTDRAERNALHQEAETILLEDSPILPVYFYTRVYLLSSEVKGWHANPLGYISFKSLYLEPAAQ